MNVTLKTTTKSSFTLKNITYKNQSTVVDEDGNEYDVMKTIESAFGTQPFTLSACLQVNEEKELDDEVDE